jgi:hypothetical protein
VRRSASRPGDSLPLHEPRSHQAVESLPNGGRRHAQPIREFTNLEGGIAPTLLTVWWIVLFQFTAPATIFALFGALYA